MCNVRMAMLMIAIIMGTMDATVAAVIECWGGARCRGMLASAPAREPCGVNAGAGGGAGGDHSSHVPQTGERVTAGGSSAARTPCPGGGGSRCGEERERSSSSEAG